MIILSSIAHLFFIIIYNPHLSISIALCCASTISRTYVVCCTSTYTSMESCSSASTTFSSLASFCIFYASTKCCSIVLSSFDSSMNIRSIDVTFGHVCSLAHQSLTYAQKLNYECSNYIYVLNYHLCKLYLLIIHLPFCAFRK
jgi:hypothetical protein